MGNGFKSQPEKKESNGREKGVRDSIREGWIKNVSVSLPAL